MGLEHVKAAGMYQNGAEGTLSFESFPYKNTVTTCSADSPIAGSVVEKVTDNKDLYAVMKGTVNLDLQLSILLLIVSLETPQSLFLWIM